MDVTALTVGLAGRRSVLPLVDDVTLSVERGEILGIVGESGSGKSMLALALMGLLPGAVRVIAGTVRFDGMTLTGMAERSLNALRGARMSMIFQEPMTALNPMMRVGEQVTESLLTHRRCGRAEAQARLDEVFEEVGLTPPRQVAGLYPHQLSGGMRQRVMIAIAIACEPEIVIADEPTTALDVTVQAQILALLRAIVRRRACTLILISHDIGVIAALCDRVAVMYAGSLVEDCEVAAFLEQPRHPYSRLLVDTYVDADMPLVRPLPIIAGTLPAPADEVPGCRFHPRCPERIGLCRASRPLAERLTGGDLVACHRWRDLQARSRQVGVS